MGYLSDWMDAERRSNPDKFDSEMDLVWFRHRMRVIAMETADTSAALAEAADRLDEILR